jgi:hypothetical protein
MRILIVMAGNCGHNILYDVFLLFYIALLMHARFIRQFLGYCLFECTHGEMRLFTTVVVV